MTECYWLVDRGERGEDGRGWKHEELAGGGERVVGMEVGLMRGRVAERSGEEGGEEGGLDGVWEEGGD